MDASSINNNKIRLDGDFKMPIGVNLTLSPRQPFDELGTVEKVVTDDKRDDFFPVLILEYEGRIFILMYQYI